jgi:hypothetical protein
MATEMICDLCGGAGEPLRVFESACVCSDCGFVFVPKRRSPEEIANDWSTVYEDGYDPQWPGVQARLFYVAEWLHRKIVLENSRILDIGAGDGSFLWFCDDNKSACAGIEPYKKNILGWDPEWACHNGPWETCDWLPKFDVCTMNWTLENCGDPVGMLKYAGDMADTVVVSTGSRILVPYKKPLSSYLGPHNPDLHAFRWSRNSLARAMWKAGLEVVEENDWNERDEMILVGRKGDKEPMLPPERDSPEAVQSFFDSWGMMFP